MKRQKQPPATRDMIAEAITLVAQQPMSEAVQALVNEWLAQNRNKFEIMGTLNYFSDGLASLMLRNALVSNKDAQP